jgi:hypothetical protein
MTVLQQIVAHLDGWSGLGARVVTRGRRLADRRNAAQNRAQTWQCVHERQILG